jgi:hypothetical protein
MDPYIAPLDVYFISLFNYRTLNTGIVIIISETRCCMKWTTYYKFILIIESWIEHVDCFEARRNGSI